MWSFCVLFYQNSYPTLSVQATRMFRHVANIVVKIDIHLAYTNKDNEQQSLSCISFIKRPFHLNTVFSITIAVCFAPSTHFSFNSLTLCSLCSILSRLLHVQGNRAQIHSIWVIAHAIRLVAWSILFIEQNVRLQLCRKISTRGVQQHLLSNGVFSIAPCRSVYALERRHLVFCRSGGCSNIDNHYTCTIWNWNNI